jgi:hypothetical protein
MLAPCKPIALILQRNVIVFPNYFSCIVAVCNDVVIDDASIAIDNDNDERCCVGNHVGARREGSRAGHLFCVLLNSWRQN